MKQINLIYYSVFFLWYLLSLLPLRFLYFISDLLFYPLYYCIRYRRKIIRNNLSNSFPEKDLKEIVQIEKQFYSFFCDYMESMNKKNKDFCFIYLGHYCNWEWIASLPYWISKDISCGQIYHPLYNQAFDKLFLRLRNQFGGECIPMKTTLRRIIELKRTKQKAIIGFISDQAPKWNSIHHWTEFLNQETPVFIGTEKIGKQVDALIYYADITRVKRGSNHCATPPGKYPILNCPICLPENWNKQ